MRSGTQGGKKPKSFGKCDESRAQEQHCSGRDVHATLANRMEDLGCVVSA